MSQGVSCSIFRSHALVKRHQSTPKFCSTSKVAPHTCATLEVEPLPPSGSGLAPSILSSIALDITYVDLQTARYPSMHCIWASSSNGEKSVLQSRDVHKFTDRVCPLWSVSLQPLKKSLSVSQIFGWSSLSHLFRTLPHPDVESVKVTLDP